MKKTVLWGCGAGFRMILNIFPSLIDYVDVFVDRNPCIIQGISVKSTETLAYTDVGMLIICSYKFEEKIRSEAIEKYHIDVDKIISLNQYLLHQLNTCKDFLLHPTQIAIDASTMCQLNCRDCYMRRGDNGTMGHGYLKLENFRKIIENNPTIKHIELSNSGEVFLNPDLKSIIHTAAENNISLSMENGVNFNDVSEDIILEMVLTQAVKSISIALDGASQHTYEIYRRKGRFDRVIDNIRKLNEMKEKYNSEYPVLKWSYIIFEHTEEDVGLAKKMADELGMEIFFSLAWEIQEGWQPKNAEKLKELTGLEYFTRKDYSEQKKQNYMINVCSQLFTSPYFNWDGRLLGCCWVYTSDWKKNIFKNSLVELVNSEQYRMALCMVLGGDVIRDDLQTPCSICSMRNEYLRGTSTRLF